MHILVTGSTGQVGSELRDLSAQWPDWRFTFVGRREMDLQNETDVRATIARLRPDWVLNCAAYTQVDKAESEPEMAFRANAEAPGWIAEACAGIGARLIHLSTDYVYRPDANTPIEEDFPTGPTGVYGASKLEGDRRVLAALPSALVIRTAWVYSFYGHNFVKTMLRFGRERGNLRVVFDQIGSPTYARDLAAAMLHLVGASQGREQDFPGGIYHYSNEGVCSWYDFALAIFELSGVDCRVAPIRSAEFPTPAQRPPFSLLDKSKTKRTFALDVPYWRDSLRHCLARLAADRPI
jgi:dTDP-4-dehydrorhamnose reductase